MMPRRRLLILLGAFVLLLAAAFLQGRSNGPQPTLAPPTAEITVTPTLLPLLRIFPDMTVLDIQAIRIEDPNTSDSIILTRDASNNWIAPDHEGQLDTDDASDIARTIILIPYSRSINITSQTVLGDYGFEPNGQLFISLVMKNGEGHVLAVGALSETDPVYYALLDERDEIFEVERGPVEFLRNFLLSPPFNLTN
jgi:hypothetical protein